MADHKASEGVDPDARVPRALEESAVDPQESREAWDPDIGDGTPQTAPERAPSLSIIERLRLRAQR